MSESAVLRFLAHAAGALDEHCARGRHGWDPSRYRWTAGLRGSASSGVFVELRLLEPRDHGSAHAIVEVSASEIERFAGRVERLADDYAGKLIERVAQVPDEEPAPTRAELVAALDGNT